MTPVITSGAPMVQLDGVHCGIGIARPAAGVVVLILRGNDVGELGDAPFRELAADLRQEHPLQLFVDARHVSAASLEVSSEWAHWLSKNRSHFARITMLPGSRFVEITAEFVRSYADLFGIMRITTDPASFDAALAVAIGHAADHRSR